MSKNKATIFFNQRVKNFAENYAKKASFRDRLDLFVGAIKRTTAPGGRILDFGCGPGIISLALAQQGFRVLGFDGSPGMVARARADARRQRVEGAEFQQADAASLHLEARAFDAVVCSSVLEYIRDDWGLLGELAASLKPEGHLLVSVPHTASILALAEHLLRLTKLHLKRAGSQHLAYSLRRYPPRKFIQKLQEIGIDCVVRATFEFPFLGTLGVALSRCQIFGDMLFVVGQKRREPGSAAMFADTLTGNRSRA